MKSLLLGMSMLASIVAISQQLKPLDANLTNLDYPFPVNYISLQNQDQTLRMAYMDLKPEKANGKTVLLLHGKNFNGSYWEQTAKALAAEGFRVIMPDQVGFGKSTKPAHYQYSFQQLADNTMKVLDKAGIDKFVLLGHSMGGMLATKIAATYPERVQKLILENPIGLEDYRKFSPWQSVDKQYADELAKTYEDHKKYQLQFYYDNKWKPEYDKWLDMLAGWTISPDYPLIAWNNALTSDMIFTQPVIYDFPQIKAPTLLIIGTRDRTAIGKANAPSELQAQMGLYNELGKKTQAAIAGSKLIELENIGHMPHIEAFDRFWQPLITFLKQ